MVDMPVDRRAFASAYDPRVVAGKIQQYATEIGVDPEIALRVAKSEGLYGYTGDQGSSFGPFQLHYGNVAGGGNKVGGLGDTFTQVTGLDARDPRTVDAQIQFALNEAKIHGWGAWHGWKGDPRAGLPGGPQGEAAPMQARPVQPILYSAPVNQYASAGMMNDAMPLQTASFQPAAQPAAQMTHDNFLDDAFLSPQPIATQRSAVQAPVTQAPQQAPAQAPAAITHDNFLNDEQLFGEKPAAQAAPTQQQQGQVVGKPPENWGVGRSFLRGASMGLSEPLEVGLSMLRHGTHGLSLGEAYQKGMENIAASRERYREEAPMTSMLAEGLGSAVGVPGATAARLVGTGVRGLRMAGAPRAAQFLAGEGGMLSRGTQAAAQGMALTGVEQAAGLTPEQDRGLGNILMGGVGGVAGHALAAPLTRAVLRPFEAAIEPEMKIVAQDVNRKFGLNIRPSQLAEKNPDLKALDERLVPSSVKTKQFMDWNAAVANDLKPGLKTLTKDTVDTEASKTGQALDNLVAGKTMNVRPDLANGLMSIKNWIANDTSASDPVRKEFTDFVRKLSQDIQYGTIKGEKFRGMISHNGYINNTFFGASKSQAMKRAGVEIRNLLIDSFELANPADAGKYRKLTEQYRKWLAVKPLVSDSGVINPQKLAAQVTKQRLVGGDLEDLARVGKYLPKAPPAEGPSPFVKGAAEFGVPHAAAAAAHALGFPTVGLEYAANMLSAGKRALQFPTQQALMAPSLAEQVYRGATTAPEYARKAGGFATLGGAELLSGYGAPEGRR
jgi:hypothetical protein